MLQVTKLSFSPPSVKVSIQLLLDLETFLFNEIPIILKLDDELIKKKYLISIEEPNIELKFNSIREYPYQLLPEKTTKISQGFSISHWELKNNNDYDVHLYFGKDKWDSEIRINFSEELPSSSVDTIEKKLSQILNNYKTLNTFFYPPTSIKSGIFAILVLSVYLSLKKIYTNIQLQALLLVIFYVFAFGIKPYSHFDTQKNNTQDRVVNYLLLLLLAAILGFLFKLFFGI